MLQFILTDIFMLSFGALIYIFLHALPRIEESPERTVREKTLIERWITSELPEKFDAIFNNFLLKFLRKLKVWALKIENIIASHLKRVTPVNEEKPSFKEVVEEVAKDEKEENNN